MFGRGQQYGEATIVARQAHEGLYHMKDHTGIYRNIWDYIADVVPEDGAPAFRATFIELFEGFDGRQPDVGEQARVKYGKDRKVEFERDGLRQDYKTAELARKDAFATLAAAAPGTGALSDVASQGATAESPPEFVFDGAGTIAAIKRARETGDLAEVERLKAEYRARHAG
jgi:hypothetical protein